MPSCFFPVLHPMHSSEGQAQWLCPPGGLGALRPLFLEVEVGVEAAEEMGPMDTSDSAWVPGLARTSGWRVAGRPLAGHGVRRGWLAPRCRPGDASGAPPRLRPRPPARPRPARAGWAGPAGRRADSPARCSEPAVQRHARPRGLQVSSCECCVPAPFLPDARDPRSPGNRGQDCPTTRVLPPPRPRAPRFGRRPLELPGARRRLPGRLLESLLLDGPAPGGREMQPLLPPLLRPGSDAKVGRPLPCHRVPAKIRVKFAF